MPNKKSAAKAFRVQERRRLRNKSVRSATRTFVKKAQVAIVGGETDAMSEVIRQAISAVDRAARKGVIHPNNAARRKSRLMKQLNKQAAAATA